MKFKDQQVSKGSSHIKGKKDFQREKYMLDFMQNNKAYIYKIEDFKKKNGNKISEDKKEELLNEFKFKYKSYRENWYGIKNLIKSDKKSSFNKPLCVDIETASICDLACPHCFRVYRDSRQNYERRFIFKNYERGKKLDIPSIKLNWRGELINPLIINL